jgi:hypothetical protein
MSKQFQELFLLISSENVVKKHKNISNCKIFFSSCSPAFMDLKHRSYSWYILSLGFFMPVIVIGCSSFLIVIKLKVCKINIYLLTIYLLLPNSN